MDSNLEKVAKDKLKEELDEIVENEHNTISRDKAFEIWVAENIAGINSIDAVSSASVGGKGDCGCDFYHCDDSARVISFGQAKWSDTFDYTLTDDDLRKYFVSTLAKLEDPPEDANKEFQNCSVEYNDVKDSCNLKIYLVIAGNLNDRAQKLFDDEDFRNLYKDENEWVVIPVEDLLNTVVVDRTKPLIIDYETKPISKKDPTTGKNSIVGFVNAKQLVKLCKDPNFEKSIFLENPRKSLRKTVVNRGLLESLENNDERKKFYKLNNGVTACCNKIQSNSDTEFEIGNFKIVNGRQTTYALSENSITANEVFVELKIHEIEDETEMRLISRTTNSQNIVKSSDLASGADALRELKVRFESYNNKSSNDGKWLFELQRGDYSELGNKEKKIYTRKRKLEKEPMARNYLAFNFQPSNGIGYSEKNIFDIDSKLFENIFQKRQVTDFIIPHIFWEALSQLAKNWKGDISKEKENDLLRQKIVRFHLLSFIHDSLITLPEKDTLTKKIIESFENLDAKDPLPKELINIAEKAYASFEKPWKDLAKVNKIDPFDYTTSRKFLIGNSKAIDELLDTKHDLEKDYSKNMIAEAIENFSY